MKLESTRTVTDYYVTDGLVPYKVTRESWNPAPSWRNGSGDRWKVFASQGSHRYARECDETKATHKRVVGAVQWLLANKGRE